MDRGYFHNRKFSKEQFNLKPEKKEYRQISSLETILKALSAMVKIIGK
jgi:hypothetical protein